MEEIPVDSISGLDYDYLSALVFNFFFNSTRGFPNQDDTWEYGYVHNILTGSLKEHLELPFVVSKITGQQYQADVDIMMEITMDAESLVATQDKKYPLHCYLPTALYDSKHETIPNDPSATLYDFLSAEDAIKFQEAGLENFPSAKTVTYSDVTVKVTGRNTHVSPSQDNVPCVKIKCPTSILQKLLYRGKEANKSCLPKLQRVVKDLHDENIHVVYKPHVHSSNPDIQWRFSFSLMERKLARSLNDTQRTAYRVLKALVLKMNDKVDEDDKMPSYLLKTALFWVCEGLPKGFCIPRNTGKVFLAILDKLIVFLEGNFFPHFFVPKGDLIDKYTDEIVHGWLKDLLEIRTRPINKMLEFWKTHKLLHEDEINFEECVKFQKAVKVLDYVLDYHFITCNFVDFMRLYNFSYHVFCTCANFWITDFFRGCQTCLLVKFCEVIDKILFHPNTPPPSVKDVALFPHIANILFARSLRHPKPEFYENKVIKLFNMAQTLYTNMIHSGLKNSATEYHTQYALYLIAKRRYEEAVKTILQLLLLDLTEANNFCTYLPFFYSEMLDEVLQIKLIGKTELRYFIMDLAYYILLSSYIQAGVYAEIILPPNAFDSIVVTEMATDFPAEKPGYIHTLNLTFKLAAMHVGDQFFLRKDYYQAAQWYITQTSKEPEINKGFVVCIANMFNETNFQNTAQKINKNGRK